MKLIQLDDRAIGTHGLIARDTCGWTRSAWYRALDRGWIEQLHPGVARLIGTPRTQEQRIAAAVIAAGGRALASHRSAALLWGFPRARNPEPIDVILPVRSRKLSLHGVIVHRPTDERRLGPHRRAGVRCTGAMRTLLDLGAVDPNSVSAAVGHALSTGLASLDAMEHVLLEHSRPGRAGVGPLRRAVDVWAVDAKPADSVLELAFGRLCDRYDLAPMDFHAVIEGWEVDFRIIGTCLIVECDGWTHHGLDRSGFERDRRKDNDLAAAGWIVRRFTYRQIVSRPSNTADVICRLVDHWSHVIPPDAT